MWHYKDHIITALDQLPTPELLFGFVYQIRNLQTGKIYIGRKNLYSTRKTAVLKKNRTLTKKGTVNKNNLFKRVTKESDWLKYWSSCDTLKTDVKLYGETNFRREILELCTTARMLSYLEVKYQFTHRVLEIDSYNGNILGKYYNRDVQPCHII
jgi:hypothetical protein